MTGAATIGKTEKRDDSIDFIKGCLIFLVVFGHSIQFIAYSCSDGFMSDAVFQAIYMFHMPLFIFVSGWVYALSGVPQTAGAFFSRKIVPLLGPLLFWSLLLAAPGVLRLAPTDPAAAVERALWWIWSSYWFLWAVVVGAVVVRLSRAFPQRRLTVAACLTAAVWALPLTEGAGAPVRYTVPFFIAGYFLQDRGLLAARTVPTTAAAAACVAATACFFMWTPDVYIYANQLRYWRADQAGNLIVMYVGAATAAFVALLFLRGLHQAAPAPVRRLAATVGEASLPIYLIHSVVFAVAQKIGIACVAESGANGPGSALRCAYAFAATVAIIAGVVGLRRLPLPRPILFILTGRTV